VRTEILRDLRLGVYDVVVGINLLREGSTCRRCHCSHPRCRQGGFLRSETSLIQTWPGRDTFRQGDYVCRQVTDAMRMAIRETNRRRDLQLAYNQEHGITPGDGAQGDPRLLVPERCGPRRVYAVETGYPESELPVIIASWRRR